MHYHGTDFPNKNYLRTILAHNIRNLYPEKNPTTYVRRSRSGPRVDGKSPSLEVVEAVARSKDERPEAVEPPLTEAIDPDALNALFARRNSTDRSLQLSFRYSDRTVTIDHEGRVRVRAEAETPAVDTPTIDGDG